MFPARPALAHRMTAVRNLPFALTAGRDNCAQHLRAHPQRWTFSPSIWRRPLRLSHESGLGGTMLAARRVGSLLPNHARNTPRSDTT